MNMLKKGFLFAVGTGSCYLVINALGAFVCAISTHISLAGSCYQLPNNDPGILDDLGLILQLTMGTISSVGGGSLVYFLTGKNKLN